MFKLKCPCVIPAKPCLFTKCVSSFCELLNFKLVLLQALALLRSNFRGAGNWGSKNLLPAVSQLLTAGGGAGCPASGARAEADPPLLFTGRGW